MRFYPNFFQSCVQTANNESSPPIRRLKAALDAYTCLTYEHSKLLDKYHKLCRPFVILTNKTSHCINTFATSNSSLPGGTGEENLEILCCRLIY